ncbi:MAG: hypothetical protein QXZ25_03490 [Candidatus Bathyarchaeia archaeon]
MNKKHYYLIEVKVPDGARGWREVVNNKLRHAIEKLRDAVEELGGEICVRY